MEGAKRLPTLILAYRPHFIVRLCPVKTKNTVFSSTHAPRHVNACTYGTRTAPPSHSTARDLNASVP